MLLLSGVVCIVGAARSASQLRRFRRLVMPIYGRLGLVPAAPAFRAVPTEVKQDGLYVPQR